MKAEMICAFCHQPIVADKTHSGLFYSVATFATGEGSGKIHAVREQSTPRRSLYILIAGNASASLE